MDIRPEALAAGSLRPWHGMIDVQAHNGWPMSKLFSGVMKPASLSFERGLKKVRYGYKSCGKVKNKRFKCG